MDPKEQDDALARRREQNRLAQRRFRFKQSQHRATTRDQEKQQQHGYKATRASSVHQIDTPSTIHHQPRTLRPAAAHTPEQFDLITPSPSSDSTEEQILSVGHLRHQPPFGTETSNNSQNSVCLPRSNSIASTTDTACQTERAQSIALGMGGLLGNQGSLWDFTELGAFSPPPQLTSPEGYSGNGLRASVFLPPPSYQEHLGDNDPLSTPTFVSGTPAREDSDQQLPTTPLFDDAMLSSRRRTPDNTPTQTQRRSHSSSSQRPQQPPFCFPVPPQEQKRQPQESHHTPRDTSTTTDAHNPKDKDNVNDNEIWLGPLHLAASKGHDRIVQMLLKHRQPVDSPDSNGQTALMHAVQGGFEDVVRCLLDAGAAVDSVDKRGRTALHWAVMKRRRRLLARLLEYGNVNSSGNTEGEDERRRMVSVDVYDDEGQTPLHRAIHSGFEAGVEVLLEFGADMACRARAPGMIGEKMGRGMDRECGD